MVASSHPRTDSVADVIETGNSALHLGWQDPKKKGWRRQPGGHNQGMPEMIGKSWSHRDADRPRAVDG